MTETGKLKVPKLVFQQSSQRFLVPFISYLNFPNLLLNGCHFKCNSWPISLTVNLLFIVRFLRHVPVIYVDYPGPTSLTQIYGTFNRAMLRIVPPLRSYAQPLTDAMVEFYSMSQVKRSLERFLLGHIGHLNVQKAMKRLPCWCTKQVLWKENCFLMKQRKLFKADSCLQLG